MYKAYRSTIERKNQLRWQRIVRLDGLGLPVQQIAKRLGYTYDQVRRTLESPYYQEWRKARLEGRVSAFDRELSEDTEEMRAELRALVPPAIRCIERALCSENESIGLRAAVEVLDRDARFNKAQNIGVTHQFTISQAEKDRALAIIKELKVVNGGSETKVLDVETSPLAVTPLLPKRTETD